MKYPAALAWMASGRCAAIGYRSCSMTVKRSRSNPASASSSGGTSGSPYGRLDHDAQRHRLGQRQLLPPHPFADLRVHQLEMHVGDPFRGALDDLQVVAAAVRDVPGVQAQVDELRVGVLEELLDPVLGVDVGVGVRVEHQLDAELLVEDPAQLVGARDQVRPLLRVHVGGLQGLSGVHVGVLLRQVDEVLRADLA